AARAFLLPAHHQARALVAPLLRDLALGFRQSLWLDQQALTLVAAPAAAEAHDDGRSRALGLGPAREQGIARSQELEVAEPDAAQAGRPRLLHHEKIAGAAAAVARPVAVQRLDDHKLGRAARRLDQPLPLLFGQLLRDPVGPILP